MNLIVILALIFAPQKSHKPEFPLQKVKAIQLLDKLNKKAEDRAYRRQVALWAYDTNITDTNLNTKLKVLGEIAKEEKEDWLSVIKFNWTSLDDYDLRRQFQKKSRLGTSALSNEKNTKLQKTITKMKKIYSTSKICDFEERNKCDLSLTPDLTDILANSRNPKQLEHVWVEWRNAVGPRVKSLFKDYVSLVNEAARLNNFTDNAENWLSSYEDPTFAKQSEQLWQQLKPLYLQLHAYVRTQLKKKYGDIVTEKGPIPAHLLGDMWAQSWITISGLLLPYPDKAPEDLTTELKKQNYTPLKIYKTSEDFFVSINLTAMPETFWQHSLLEKPKNREVVCHASAWDFYNGKDFRIKHCTEVNKKHFITAHHEMGHVEYYLQYKNQPITFRRGANAGFHEAVGDLISLSVQSRKHLRRIGLLKAKRDDTESTMNSIFQVALHKIVLLPFAYLIDLWRWDIFKGRTNAKHYNCKWWELREKYQGIEPPVNRSESDFDAAAKYHIVADVPYLRYFVSRVLQFQFHRALCKIAGEFDPTDPHKPLHQCDIYKNTAAGNALKKMLAMGSSRPWHDAIEVLTGQRTMDASALLEYFEPLHKWLVKENKRSGAFIGWEKTKKSCISNLE